jgi:hypothetical protein
MAVSLDTGFAGASRPWLVRLGFSSCACGLAGVFQKPPPPVIRTQTHSRHLNRESKLSLSRYAIQASFQSLHEHREKATALAQAALTVMREQRDSHLPSDGELVIGVLLELLERRDDLADVEVELSGMLEGSAGRG